LCRVEEGSPPTAFFFNRKGSGFKKKKRKYKGSRFIRKKKQGTHSPALEATTKLQENKTPGRAPI